MDAAVGDAVIPDLGPVRFRQRALPEEEVIFVSTDSVGNSGQLNTWVLSQLKLDHTVMPSVSSLTKGYSIVAAGTRLLCFIVTIDGLQPTERLLSKNLHRCLLDPHLRGAHSYWLPLMGTGTGDLPLETSLERTIQALYDARLLRRKAVRITVSLPSDGDVTLAPMCDVVDQWRDTFQHPQPSSDPNTLKAAPAAQEVLSLALALGEEVNEPALTTELLMFALMVAGSSRDATHLHDRAASNFAAAIRELAGSALMDAWHLYFEDLQFPHAVSDGRVYPRVTPNIKLLLERASASAREQKKLSYDVEDLVNALLRGPGQYVDFLKTMSVRQDDLHDVFSDLQSSQLSMKLHNDAASHLDHLGYASVADAIAAFLRNPATPAPLSVSIQAPWGAGKSSLMRMVRERLDPEASRTPPAARSSHLLMETVRCLLNRESTIGEIPEASPITTRTVWFNAWQYESGEQIWAGLVDALVTQISDRLPLDEKEAFLLRLQLARIDDGIVRKRIHDRLINAWLAAAKWWLAGFAGFMLILMLLVLAPFSAGVLTALHMVGISAGAITTVALGWLYKCAKDKLDEEPASYSLSDLMDVPDYSQALGSMHKVHADLQRIFRTASPSTESAPIVVFIDDLDRCSPSKVASVVEGVSMLLASDTYPCMFVIGMDPQVVAAALDSAHGEIRKHLPQHEKNAPLGWRFMDKFIQLPFTIPPQPDMKAYLASLGGQAPVAIVAGDTPVATEASITARHEGEEPTDAEGDAEAEIPEAAAAVQELMTPEETRDVARIITVLSGFSGTNPREVKRMVNMARLFLALRNERRRRDRFWQAPGLEQYARWIALSLRWPGLARWLQWGSDQTVWPDAPADGNLLTRRLKLIEDSALAASTVKDWSASLGEKLCLGSEDCLDWRLEQGLLAFMRDCAGRSGGARLSSATAIGFW